MASKNIIIIQYYKTTIGELILGCFKNELCILDFRYQKMRSRIDKRIQTGLNAIYLEKETPLLATAQLQIKAYLNGTRKTITLPIKMVGTPFQLSVWNALQTIPYGATISYLELAKQIGDKNAVEAVADASDDNALALIIPNHRVIGLNNKLVEDPGGVRVKNNLLKLEQTHF